MLPQTYFKKILLAVFLLLGVDTFAQEMLGLRNSNFAGIHGIGLNPASMVDSRLKWDVNLFSAGVSFENDYLFIPKSKLDFLGLGNIVRQVEKQTYLDEFDATKNNLYFSSSIMGPGVMFPITNKHSVAVFVQGRTAISCNGFTAEASKYAYEGFDFSELHFDNTGKLYDVSDIEFNAMAWLEYGLSYAAMLKETDQHAVKAGVTLKYLQGISAGYVSNMQGDFNVLNDSDMVFQNFSADYGRVNYNAFDNIDRFSDLITGRGFGVDLGVTYEWRRDPSNYTYEMDGKRELDMEQNKYDVRIGVSLLDMGSILYNRNANTFRLESDSAFYPDWDVDNFSSNLDFDYSMSEIFYGDPLRSTRDSKFRMRLPGALSIQADVRLSDRFYVNSTIIQRIQNKSPGVDRASIYSITPRYENLWFEAALPVSLVSYQTSSIRVGMALYLGAFWIGTDKMGTLFGLNDLYGADIYAAFKYSIPWRRKSDRDQDKVSDKKDRCVDIPGLLKFEGCPDRDGDNIEDARDTCPDIPGLPEFNGCPDRDGDKIIDMRDSCPDLPGIAEFYGCPDRDGDKIIDPRDTCPDVPGLALYYGCPDTDNDSIPDHLDRCPLVFGLRELNGCPLEEKIVPVQPALPPPVNLTAEEQEIINTVFKNLQFETGKAIIRPVSFTSLDALADLMKKKPEFKLLIEGHTDNVGGAAMNLSLSKKRAKAAKDYLVAKGVEASRITDKGYGLTKPVSTNKTAEGREQNRRVEFTIVQ
jgi:outer membrane protein OmpA-like peptidoglycan-associated protein